MFLLNLLSCQYEIDDVYAPNIAKPSENPNFTIKINLPNVEKVNLFLPSRVEISLDNDSIIILGVKFYIDNTEIPASKEGNIYYTSLYPNDFDQHSLKAEVFTSSGSKSMVDELEMEGYVFTSTEWIYQFKKFDESKNAQSSIIPDGALITWNSFSGLNFNKYIIERDDIEFSFESDINQFIDTNYFGENAEYKVYVKTDDGGKYLWATHKTGTHLFDLKYETVNNRTALTWKLPVFNKNTKEYRFYMQTWDGWKLQEIAPKEINYFYPEDYIECALGDFYNFIVQIVPVNNVGVDTSNYLIRTNNLQFGVEFKIQGEVITSNSRGALLHDNNYFYYFNAITETNTQLLAYTLGSYAVSPDLKLLLVQLYSGEIYIYNLEKLHTYGEFELIKNLPSIAESIGWGFYDLSNNGIIATRKDNFIYIYDLINEQIISKIDGQSIYDAYISPNGEKLLLFQDGEVVIHRINNSSTNIINRINLADVNFTHTYNIKSINSEMFCTYFDNENIEFRSYEDLSLVRSFPIDFERLLSIDEANNRYMTLGYVNETYWVFINDLTSGEELFKIPKFYSNDFGYQSAFLSNNTVYINNYTYKLNK